MTTILSPKDSRMPKTALRLQDPPQDGLRRWTTDEYHRMIEMGLFGGARVEMRSGGIRQAHDADLYCWTREQYHRLIEAGFFDDGRVELLEGLIWDMAGQMTPHATGVRLATLALEKVFAEGCEVRSQFPIILPDGAEPEPDVAIVPGTPLDYAENHPRADELLLAVEVSDSTLVKDRGPKLASYARARIAEYWIVNLVHRQLEVYRRPSPAGLYADFTTHLPDQSVAPLNALGKPIAVADLLPPEARQNL